MSASGWSKPQLTPRQRDVQADDDKGQRVGFWAGMILGASLMLMILGASLMFLLVLSGLVWAGVIR